MLGVLLYSYAASCWMLNQRYAVQAAFYSPRVFPKKHLTSRFMSAHIWTIQGWSGYGIPCKWETVQGAYETATGQETQDKGDARVELCQWIMANLDPSFRAYCMCSMYMKYLLITPRGAAPRRLGGEDMEVFGPRDDIDDIPDQIAIRQVLNIPPLAIDHGEALTNHLRALLGSNGVLDFSPGMWTFQSPSYMGIEEVASIAGRINWETPKPKFDMDQKDCQFEVGPEKVRLAVNRAWIASKSDKLRSCVYGAGSIEVDPSASIPMPLFNAEAFKYFLDRLEVLDYVPWFGVYSDPPYSHVTPDMYKEVKLLADYFNVDFLNLYLVSSDFDKTMAFGCIEYDEMFDEDEI
jgi:hypothetical protein